MVIVAAASAYTWYTGRNIAKDLNSVAIADPVAARPISMAKHVRTSPDAPVGVSIQVLTSPIMPGDQASVTIKTNPYANCNILVTYNKIAAVDGGLVAQEADDYGVASWSWTVGSNTPLGKWPVKITCATAVKSGMVIGGLVVSNQVEEP